MEAVMVAESATAAAAVVGVGEAGRGVALAMKVGVAELPGLLTDRQSSRQGIEIVGRLPVSTE